jgi:hypothetical protein
MDEPIAVQWYNSICFAGMFQSALSLNTVGLLLFIAYYVVIMNFLSCKPDNKIAVHFYNNTDGSSNNNNISQTFIAQ